MANTCVILSGGLNDIQGAAIYSRYALKLMKKINHRPIESATTLCAYCFGLHHSIPAVECLKPLRKGYEIGMSTGDIESAYWCIYHYFLLSFQSGKPLSEIDRDCTKYIKMIVNSGVRLLEIRSKGFWYTIRSLHGKSKDVASVELTEVDKDIVSARLENAYIGNFKACADMYVDNGEKGMKAFPGAIGSIIDSCCSGFSCAVMARRTGQTKYIKIVKKFHKRLRTWMRKGNPNIVHWVIFLDAEAAARKSQRTTMIRKYEESILIAQKSGLIHDAAIMNECFGDVALEVLDEAELAQQKFQESICLFTQWGAFAALSRLKGKLENLRLNQ